MKSSIRKPADCIAVALGAACALALLPTPGFARDLDDTRSATVHYADLNLDTAAGASTLYSRLTRASKDVCGDESEIIDISQLKAIETCRKQTLVNAVACVDRPMLTAVYDGRHPDALLATTVDQYGRVSST